MANRLRPVRWVRAAVHDLEDGEVPQVHPVGDGAEIGEHGPRQRHGQRTLRRTGHRQQHHGRQQRTNHESALVDDVAIAPDVRPLPQQGRRRCHPGSGQDPSRLQGPGHRDQGVVPTSHLDQGQHRGQGTADHDGLGVGVGPEVQPVGGGTGSVETGHPGRGQECPAHRHGEGHIEAEMAVPSTQPQDGDEEQRPHQVELLFDGQRPRVGEQRRCAAGGEVVGAGGDEMPIAEVAQHGQGILAVARVLPLWGHEVHKEGHADQHEKQGRQEPADPSGVEGSEADALGPLPLPEQDQRDDQTREHEEGVLAEVPADVDARDTGVVGHDGQDGHAPDTVEGCDPATASRVGRRVGRAGEGSAGGGVGQTGSLYRATPARARAPTGRTWHTGGMWPVGDPTGASWPTR